MQKRKSKRILIGFFVLAITLITLNGCSSSDNKKPIKPTLTILSSSENKTLLPLIQKFTSNQNFEVNLIYKGSVDIMGELTNNEAAYDAVWSANSQWVSLGDKSKKVKNMKSIMSSPVIWGIKKSLAEQLGFVGKPVTIKQLTDAVSQKKLKFAMTSATQSNSGASAYLGFLSAALNSPPIITMQDLHSNDLAQKMTTLLGGVNRSSGSSEWLKALFLVGDFDAMVNYEALILETNQQRIANNKEPLYMVYPVDGTTIADYGLGYINNGNNEQEKNFQLLQDYLLSAETQAEIQKLGRRTGYGGVMKNVDAKVFVPEWGFDANRVLSAINFPESDVMLEALNLYQTAFKKPSYTVFLLDFSGSMSNNGEANLKKGMELILDQTIAKQNLLQGSNSDTIVVIPFNDHVIDVWKSVGIAQYPDLLNKINNLKADGGTNIYLPAINALDILKDVNPANYTISITLMTDGRSEDNFSDLEQHFKTIGKDIPIYSILFGDALPSQLKGIADLTKADVFDSNGDLVAAFKKARGYN